MNENMQSGNQVQQPAQKVNRGAIGDRDACVKGGKSAASQNPRETSGRFVSRKPQLATV